jgi:hypothetical protein
MIQIDNTIVSLDLLEQFFCCDLATCKGICCIEGDSGAPLEQIVIAEIEKVLPIIWDDLSEKAKLIIKEQGFHYTDIEGDIVTSIIDGKECVFSYIDNGVCKCAIEKAFKEGKTNFYKPISCHLYPIRITEYKTFTAVNYHKWDICKCAKIYGEKNKIPAYIFLKDALVRRFGNDWYQQLKQIAELYKKEKDSK